MSTADEIRPGKQAPSFRGSPLNPPLRSENGPAQYARLRPSKPAGIEKSAIYRPGRTETVASTFFVLRAQRLHEMTAFGAHAPLRIARHENMTRIRQMVVFVVMMAMSSTASADPSDPDLIFRKSTTFKFLTPNDKLAVYGIDDPLVDGVACHYTTPEKGGLSGALGLAEQTSDISLACRQYGPIKFKGTFAQGDVVFSERRSLFFKKMQIVRGCDTRRNILVYMTYSDKLIEGSPKNSTSTVPI